MALRRITFQAAETDRGRRLDEVLSERLPEALGQPISRSKIRKLIVAGAVAVDGRRIRVATVRLTAGARVEAAVDLARLLADGRAKDRAFVMTPERVLYEDARILVVDKPAGLPVHPTLDGARENLFQAVQRFLADRAAAGPAAGSAADPAADPAGGAPATTGRSGGAPAEAPYLALHHRLDRDTSGALLLVKDPAANAAVAELFAERRVVKRYLALTTRPSGPSPRAWTTRSFLGPAPRRPGGGKRTRFASVRSGGKPSHTDFQVVERLPKALLVAAWPHTGRTHQIRVHLAEAGMPILGDDLYGPSAGGGAPSPGRDPAPSSGRDPARTPGRDPGGAQGCVQAPRLMLHAAALTFPDPESGAEITIESPLPPDFQACLESHRGRRKPRPRPRHGPGPS